VVGLDPVNDSGLLSASVKGRTVLVAEAVDHVKRPVRTRAWPEAGPGRIERSDGRHCKETKGSPPPSLVRCE
jgi:hypothetical protein